MALVSTERDRGTLGWTLTNPVSPTSVISAKFIVAFGVFVATAILLPMLVSVGLATVVYGGLPDLRRHRDLLVLFLALPAFYITLTIALGTGVKSTVGVAGIAFAVLFLPQVDRRPAADRERALTDVDRVLGDARRQGPAGVDAHADRLGDLDGRPDRRGEAGVRSPGAVARPFLSPLAGRMPGAPVRRFRFGASRHPFGASEQILR